MAENSKKIHFAHMANLKIGQGYSSASMDDHGLEGLDVPFASELLQGKILQMESQIEQNQHLNMDFLPDIRARNKWYILVLYKFREAMVTLYSMQ